MNDVTLVTLTEFGRRVEENGSGGVDHGYGQAVLLLGGGIKGGQVHGQWPGLAGRRLDRRRPERAERLPQGPGGDPREALRGDIGQRRLPGTSTRTGSTSPRCVPDRPPDQRLDAASTPRTDRHDSSDQRDAPESADPIDANEPTERIDATDPAERTDRNDPTEPIESIEPFEPIERNESDERIDRNDPVESNDQRDVSSPRRSPILTNRAGAAA